MGSSSAWGPSGTTKTISASVTSASATWASNETAGDAIRIYNACSVVAFVRFGKGAQTATSADIPIAPGSVEIIGCTNAVDTVAVILPSSAGSVYVTKGSGI